MILARVDFKIDVQIVHELLEEHRVDQFNFLSIKYDKAILQVLDHLLELALLLNPSFNV